MWALSSYFFYLYMVFIQHCFHLEQHCFHLDRQFSCSSNGSNWLSRILTQYSPVIQKSCSSWLSCTISVPKNTNDQENSQNNLARFWGVRRQSAVWYTNNKTSSDMYYVGWYNSKYWFIKLYWISVELLLWSMDKQYLRFLLLRYYKTPFNIK